ncbi:MAG: hypothetical protein M0011_14570 [Elusimicrobia bacterium]|nr:hypothetical protein [Elusimicrobiota bacterium]
MRWKVKEWAGDSYRATRAGALRAYIYRSLSWPDFYGGGGAAYEVRYCGRAIALLGFGGKGATVKVLAAAGGFPEIGELDLAELALWVSKLREAGSGAG